MEKVCIAVCKQHGLLLSELRHKPLLCSTVASTQMAIISRGRNAEWWISTMAILQSLLKLSSIMIVKLF